MKAGQYRELSPYLKERFEFCSSWVNARLSQNWLSLEEIDDYESDGTLKEWIEIRKENSFGDEPPGKIAPENCAIFSYNPYEPEETYLVWQDGKKEPLIWEYFGGDFLKFNDFKSYLEFIVGDKESDDSGRF
ncbi:hypothetical protein [Pseudomonas mangiferae]|uniref:SMI1/KNR4 family protein n=1 Tax=Pseudomonas mangiferae TaxID=2593654 RepID=A0A553GZ30_9PSED|nr:hypothetical protein [Pseudomonas mangiferae]TRX74771.1 hypothetical protein FM069_09525 [Pseudomonas mangiferae]